MKSNTGRSHYTSDSGMGADSNNLKRKTIIDLMSIHSSEKNQVVDMLSEESEDPIKDIFDNVDRDKDGRISRYQISID